MHYHDKRKIVYTYKQLIELSKHQLMYKNKMSNQTFWTLDSSACIANFQAILCDRLQSINELIAVLVLLQWACDSKEVSLYS